ncbi:MAG: hypothetical protein R6U13_14265, partial [Desulfatiglandaceae bacterium]
ATPASGEKGKKLVQKPREIVVLLQNGDLETGEFQGDFDPQVIETLAVFADRAGGGFSGNCYQRHCLLR